ncbi:MAG: class I SAM-dependent RNA methyltransferase [Spirochaetia bacterium]
MKRLVIEKLVPGGAGFSRLPTGKAIFVEGAYPGEDVLVEITQEKKDFAKGSCNDFFLTSPHRRKPKCPYFHDCGGCQWQNIYYENQLIYKEQILKEIWAKTHLDFNFDHLKMRPSPQEYEYRHRMQLHHDNGRLGLLAKNSHQIIHLSDCMIAHAGVRSFLQKNSPQRIRQLPNRFNIFCNHLGQNFIESIDEQAYVEIGNKSFSFAPSHFFQNHLQLLTQLIDVIFKPELKGQSAIDLYAGVGLFSAFLEDRFEKVYACEENISTASFFEKNTKHTQFTTVSVENFLMKKFSDIDCVILDPPRKGLSKLAIERLEKQHFKQLYYLSCDPVTQARDLQILSKFYQIEELYLFDFYPQTSHMEILVKLKHH